MDSLVILILLAAIYILATLALPLVRMRMLVREPKEIAPPSVDETSPVPRAPETNVPTVSPTRPPIYHLF
ncbi:MAG: hypothetical protein SGI71_11300 [Verrucomicrobiota bacterium]|nr:hypothetical protein [Verrucomicrobiota bacterium]